MKSKYIYLLVAIAIPTLTCGCSMDTGILNAKDSKSFFDEAVYTGETKLLSEDKTGSEQYRIFQQGATGFVPVSALVEEVHRRASRYCEDSGKIMKPIEERKSIPPHILGNFPRAELLFICDNKQPPEDELYIRISNLKKLLDSGAISKEEYEQQKAKILKILN